MSQEEVIKRAKQAGWKVHDISDPEVIVKTAWRHWEALRPDGTVFNNYFTESEAWEAIYFYTIDDVEE